DPKQSVIIYYANETFLTPLATANYQTLSRWMTEGGGETGAKIAGQIKTDAEVFPKAVADEINALESGIKKKPQTHLALFTNELSSQNAARIYDGRLGEWRTVSFEPPHLDNYILASNPNSH